MKKTLDFREKVEVKIREPVPSTDVLTTWSRSNVLVDITPVPWLLDITPVYITTSAYFT